MLIIYSETNIDDCVNRNCSGNGVCVDSVDSFSCECVSGFTGETCSLQILTSFSHLTAYLDSFYNWLSSCLLSKFK